MKIFLLLALSFFLYTFFSCRQTAPGSIVGKWKVHSMISVSGETEGERQRNEEVRKGEIHSSIEFRDDATYIRETTLKGANSIPATSGNYTVNGDTLVLTANSSSKLNNTIVKLTRDSLVLLSLNSIVTLSRVD